MVDEYRYTSHEPNETDIKGFGEYQSSYDPNRTYWPPLIATAIAVLILVIGFTWFTGTSWSIKTPTHFDEESEERNVSPRDRNGNMSR